MSAASQRKLPATPSPWRFRRGTAAANERLFASLVERAVVPRLSVFEEHLCAFCDEGKGGVESAVSAVSVAHCC